MSAQAAPGPRQSRRPRIQHQSPKFPPFLSKKCEHHLHRYLWGGTGFIIAYQAFPSMEFPRQENWIGLPWPPPGDLPESGIEPLSLVSLALVGRFFTAVRIQSLKGAVSCKLYIKWLTGVDQRLIVVDQVAVRRRSHG